MSGQRIRIRFKKKQLMRLIGHRDLVRTMERLFRRAGLKMRMSEGFHPKPKMSFPSALSVGVETLDEVMEIDLEDDCQEEQLLNRFRQHTVSGLEFVSVEILDNKQQKGQLESVSYEIPVPSEQKAPVTESIERFLQKESCLIRRPKREMPIDIRRDVVELRLADGQLQMKLKTSREATARPREILEAIGLDDLEDEGFYLTRTAVHLAT